MRGPRRQASPLPMRGGRDRNRSRPAPGIALRPGYRRSVRHRWRRRKASAPAAVGPPAALRVWRSTERARGIESGNAAPVETSAVTARALAGKWHPGPVRIVRPVNQSPEPHRESESSGISARHDSVEIGVDVIGPDFAQQHVRHGTCDSRRLGGATRDCRVCDRLRTPCFRRLGAARSVTEFITEFRHMWDAARAASHMS